MHQFRPDLIQMNSHLAMISQQSSSMNATMSQLSSSMETMSRDVQQFHNDVTTGFQQVEDEMLHISMQMNDVINDLKFYHNEQFIQNEQRNQLLQSIDETLKAPNKTAALEQFQYGVELAKRAKYEQAIPYFEQAITLNPLHYLSYVHLALSYFSMQQYDKALAYTNEALSHAPYYRDNALTAYTYALAATVYTKIGNPSQALTAIEQAITHHATADYTYEQARLLAMANRTDEAVATLQTAITKDPIYFSYALVDEAFASCKQPVHALLTSLKDKALANVQQQWQAIERKTFPVIAMKDAHYSDFHVKHFPNIDTHYFELRDYKWESYSFNHNKFMDLFRKGYNDCRQMHAGYVEQIRSALHDMSYVALAHAASTGTRFLSEQYEPAREAIYGFAKSTAHSCKRMREVIEQQLTMHRGWYESRAPKNFFQKLKLKGDQFAVAELDKFERLYNGTNKAAEEAYRDIDATIAFCEMYMAAEAL